MQETKKKRGTSHKEQHFERANLCCWTSVWLGIEQEQDWEIEVYHMTEEPVRGSTYINSNFIVGIPSKPSGQCSEE
jgi:hypothetical protein